jgi:homoserine dehydrogenase
MSARPLRLLLVGFGNVGRTFARILVEREHYPGLAGLDVSVVGITTASRGALANPKGVDLRAALADREAGGRLVGAAGDGSELDTPSAADTLDYDVLVELSTLAIATRGEPAASHVRQALGRGKHVITCNKGPIAWHWRELSGLAAAHGCLLLHEGTVMDGVPVFGLARWGLRGNTVERLEGVLNSTTNVVLCALEEGSGLDEAVRLAQAAGIAEADPRDDLEGWDAAVKITALANVLMDAHITPESVSREAINAAVAGRARAARERGERLKVVCSATRDGSTVRASVALRELPLDHAFARLQGAGSALRITTDILGIFVIAEEAPDLFTTAYAVIADLFTITDRLKS